MIDRFGPHPLHPVLQSQPSRFKYWQGDIEQMNVRGSTVCPLMGPVFTSKGRSRGHHQRLLPKKMPLYIDYRFWRGKIVDGFFCFWVKLLRL